MLDNLVSIRRDSIKFYDYCDSEGCDYRGPLFRYKAVRVVGDVTSAVKTLQCDACLRKLAFKNNVPIAGSLYYITNEPKISINLIE